MERNARTERHGMEPKSPECPPELYYGIILQNGLVKTVWSQDYTSQGRCREGLQSPRPQRLCGGAIDLCSEARCRERGLPRHMLKANVATTLQQVEARSCCKRATQKPSRPRRNVWRSLGRAIYIACMNIYIYYVHVQFSSLQFQALWVRDSDCDVFWGHVTAT